ncbi:MAG: prepilin peptidase [Clostridia bacterium]|nr:prepilin peptidase [Clostridia bacterium]
MVYINILGIITVSLLMIFRINLAVRFLQGKDTKNILDIFKEIPGWPSGLLFGAMSAMLLYTWKLPGFYIQLADFLLTLVMAAVIDVKFKVIPNYLIVCFLAAQIVAAFTFAQTFLGLWNVLISAAVLGILIIISLLSKEQIGMGDVKLIASVNLIYGWSFTLYTLFFSFLAMLIFAIPLLILRKLKLKSQLPFAPFYLIGVILYLLLI